MPSVLVLTIPVTEVIAGKHRLIATWRLEGENNCKISTMKEQGPASPHHHMLTMMITLKAGQNNVLSCAISQGCIFLPSQWKATSNSTNHWRYPRKKRSKNSKNEGFNRDFDHWGQQFENALKGIATQLVAMVHGITNQICISRESLNHEMQQRFLSQ